jgi:hypothetical protein
MPLPHPTIPASCPTKLQVAEVAEARPEITKAVETMVKKGKWSVPGYRVSSRPPFFFLSSFMTGRDCDATAERVS